MFHTGYTIASRVGVQMFGGDQDTRNIFKEEKILATDMGQKQNSQKLLAETWNCAVTADFHC